MTGERDPIAEDRRWPPVLVPTGQPRRPGVRPQPKAIVSAELPGLAADRTFAEAAFAALLYRYTAQERITLAVPEGALRFAAAGARTVHDLASGVGVIERPEAADEITVGFCTADEWPGGAPDLELWLLLRADSAELHYDSTLFTVDAAARFLGHYRTLLTDALRFPDRPVNRLSLLTDEEAHRTLIEWNRTGTIFPGPACLHEAFEARTAQSPEAVALIQGTESLTYRQVNAAANRLAHHLRSLGVGPDKRVGLCLERSAHLLIAELAVLKAGGAYVPLDPDYPQQRIATMVDGTSCTAMISLQDLIGNLPGAGAEGPPLILLDRDAALLDGLPEHNPEPLGGPDQLCYIIHTSGSTGTPKPIALRHRGVMNNIADLNTRFGVRPGDSVLALSSPSFDMSVYEFLGLTAAGGTVIVPDPGLAKDPGHWAELLVRHEVTVWNSAPALLGLLTDHLELSGAATPRLRLALLGGDWVPVTLPDRLRAFAPDLRFIVMGGATESSIHSTIYEVERVDPDWTSIPYGRPMANQRTYVLDDAMQPVPPGVPGELYLAGTGLARGYLDQQERTAERFTEWSFGDQVRAERLYRTGDVARLAPDGLILLIGRRDFQVKIHGLRVELGEIEAVLRSRPEVRQCVAVARDDRIFAYVTPEPADPAESDASTPAAVDTELLLKLAGQRLPQYMVPAAIVVLDRLPLTPNGKLDRLALPEPQSEGAAYRAPGSVTEEILAAAYAEVLGVERIGVDDDFLGAGGDSVRAIRAAARARAQGLDVSTRQILESRTIAELARSLATHDVRATDSGEGGRPRGALTQHDRDSPLFQEWKLRYPGLSEVWPLTPLQSGILFESELSEAGPDPYQMQTVFRLAGPLDPIRLRAAGQALLERHPGLRVAFTADDKGNPLQLVVDGVELPWSETDLSVLDEAEREGAFRAFLARDYASPFDRSVAPLLRLSLAKLGSDLHALVLTTHHVLIDGWSEPILTRELLQLYASGGDAAGLPEARDFGDFLAWLDEQAPDAAAQAWAEYLAGVDGPTLAAPGAVRTETTRAALAALELADADYRRLAQRATGLGVTLSTLFQGAWAVLIGELTGRTDVLFGAAVSGRPAALPGVESMVGLFINTVPVRARCTPDTTLAELLTGLRDGQSALIEHHHRPLVEIHRDLGLDALFDSLVAFQSYPIDRAAIAAASAQAGLEITAVDSEGAATYPLALIVETDPSVRAGIQYHLNVFSPQDIAAVTARLSAILLRLAEDPHEQIGTPASPLRIVAIAADQVQAAPDHGPEPERAGVPGDPGRAAMEESVRALVAEILGVPDVGLNDSLFTLGCDSLKATRIIGRIRRTLGAEASIKQLFQNPTVSGICDHLSSPGAPRLRRALTTPIGGSADRSRDQRVAVDLNHDTKELKSIMRDRANKQVAELTAQYLGAAKAQQPGEEFQNWLAADVEQRINRSMQRATRGSKDAAGGGERSQATQRRLKRMLSRFDEEVRESAPRQGLTEDELDEVQEILTVTASSLRDYLRPAQDTTD